MYSSQIELQMPSAVPSAPVAENRLLGAGFRVLVLCEESQTVCKEFRLLGFEAYSNDILPCSGGKPEWHLQMDAFEAIELMKWDAIIAFPPCTDLSAAGAPSWKIKQADGRQQKAIDFVKKIWTNKCKHIAIENPTGILNSIWMKPTQIIHPYYFGEPFLKRTCLWLKNLPPLYYAENDNLFSSKTLVKPEFHYTSNSTRGGMKKDGTRTKSKLPIRKAWDNSHERSKSFCGIAKAMAEQWSAYILPKAEGSVGEKIF